MSSRQMRSKTKVAQPAARARPKRKAASSSKFGGNRKEAASDMADQDTVSQHTEDHRQEEEEAAAAAERAAGEGFRNFLVNLLPDSAHTCIAPIALRVNGMVSAAAKDPVDGIEVQSFQIKTLNESCVYSHTEGERGRCWRGCWRGGRTGTWRRQRG